MRNPFRSRGKDARKAAADASEGSGKPVSEDSGRPPPEGWDAAVEREERRRRREERRQRRAEAPRAETARRPGRLRPAKRSWAGATHGARRASAEGIRATRARAGRLTPHARGIGRRAGSALGSVTALVLRAAALVERRIRAVLRTSRRGLAAAVARLERWVTPRRGAFAVVVAAAACLVVSQFMDYRGVEVGQPAYADVAEIAEPPQRAQETPVDAHSFALVALAAIAAGAGLVALLRSRWRLGSLVALCGVAGVAVIVAIDLPRGLDEGSAAIRYQGANATLNEAFYAELAAAAGLVLAGLALALALRREGRPARGRRPVRRRRSRPQDSPSLAGSGS